MKAQLSFDYYFAVITFVIFVSSLFFRLVTFFPLYSDELTNQRLRSEAYQISEILINDVGYPANWNLDVANAKRLGLSDETRNKTNIISTSKATAFNSLCTSNYNRALELLDIKDGFLASLVKIKQPPDQFQCLPSQVSAKIRAEVRRIVAFDDGTYGNLTVSMWK